MRKNKVLPKYQLLEINDLLFALLLPIREIITKNSSFIFRVEDSQIHVQKAVQSKSSLSVDLVNALALQESLIAKPKMYFSSF